MSSPPVSRKDPVAQGHRVATSRLTIAQAAEAVGLSADTLRYYEREGLMVHLPHRNAAGHRRYDEDHLAWLDVCAKLRATGMSIATLRRFAELVREGAGNEAARLDVLVAHEHHIRCRIDELEACLELITGKVTTYRRAVDRGTTGRLWT
jgi:DNA-binding transcriptional MerR regulator